MPEISSSISPNFFNAQMFETVGSAKNRDAIGSIFDRIWDSIKDFFCSTDCAEAKKCLYDLYATDTSVEEKIISFNRLKYLAGADFKHHFNRPAPQSGNTYPTPLETPAAKCVTLHAEAIILEDDIAESKSLAHDEEDEYRLDYELCEIDPNDENYENFFLESSASATCQDYLEKLNSASTITTESFSLNFDFPAGLGDFYLSRTTCASNSEMLQFLGETYYFPNSRKASDFPSSHTINGESKDGNIFHEENSLTDAIGNLKCTSTLEFAVRNFFNHKYQDSYFSVLEAMPEFLSQPIDSRGTSMLDANGGITTRINHINDVGISLKFILTKEYIAPRSEDSNEWCKSTAIAEIDVLINMAGVYHVEKSQQTVSAVKVFLAQ